MLSKSRVDFYERGSSIIRLNNRIVNMPALSIAEGVLMRRPSPLQGFNAVRTQGNGLSIAR